MLEDTVKWFFIHIKCKMMRSLKLFIVNFLIQQWAFTCGCVREPGDYCTSPKAHGNHFLSLEHVNIWIMNLMCLCVSWILLWDVIFFLKWVCNNLKIRFICGFFFYQNLVSVCVYMCVHMCVWRGYYDRHAVYEYSCMCIGRCMPLNTCGDQRITWVVTLAFHLVWRDCFCCSLFCIAI